MNKKPEYEALHFIDWYGDTIFSKYQIDTLKNDLEKLILVVKIEKDKIFLKKLLALVVKSKSRVHTYLKFVGD